MAGVFHADEDIFVLIRFTRAMEEVKALSVVGETSGLHKNLTGVPGDDGESVIELADVDSD